MQRRSHRDRTRTRTALCASIVLIASACGLACSGNHQSSSDPSGGGAAKPPTTATCEAGEVPERRVAKLSDIHYRNAVFDLFGDVREAQSVRSPGVNASAFIPATAMVPVDGGLVLQYRTAAETLAAAFARHAPGFLCSPDTVRADPCVQGWLSSFLSQAYRRPILPEELEDYSALFESGASHGAEGGVRLVIQAALQAPSFLYTTELGTPPNSGTGDIAGPKNAGALPLTDHELASQLSFWLTDHAPDAELRRAAEAGELLREPAALSAQAQRLLEAPDAQHTITEAIVRWFRLTELEHIHKDESVFPEFEPARQSLLSSVRLFIDGNVWQGARDFRDIFRAPNAYIDAALAPIYAVPAPTEAGFVRQDFATNERVGILTHPAFLARFANQSEGQVVQRGLFVRRDLLCQTLQAPPPGVNVAAITAGKSQREAASFRANEPACAGCHSAIDPFGLMFSHYNAVGAYQPTLMGEPIDATALATNTDFDGPVNGAAELSEKLAQSELAQACIVQKMLAFSLSRTAPPASCELAPLQAHFSQSGYQLSELLLAIVNSKSFRFRRLEVAE
ncbi:MAG: DUF1592 domain-containing protein [Polyangiaceae bacterium]|nr:DUF1592 domain-containing protein [Polyangiaceae bacterium]